MPDPSFVRAKRAVKKQPPDWMCWLCLNHVNKNRIVVQSGRRRGLCSQCLWRLCHHQGRLDVASYWTRDWPRASIGPIGQRRAQ